MKVKNTKSKQKEFSKIREAALNKKAITDTTDEFVSKKINKNYKEAKKTISELVIKSKDEKSFLKAIEKEDEIIKKLFTVNKSEIVNFFKGNIKNTYAKYNFEIAKQNGGVATFVKKNEKLIDKITNETFKGSDFSKRFWKQEEETKKQLKKVMLDGQSKMLSNRQMARKLSEKLDVSRYRCETLIRTETARIYSEIEKESYVDSGIKQYEFIATLDGRTSEICKEKDLSIFLVSEMEVGTNAPPMHPNCRSDTVPYFDFGFTGRMGRNLENGKSEYMDSSIKTYKDYENKYIKWL